MKEIALVIFLAVAFNQGVLARSISYPAQLANETPEEITIKTCVSNNSTIEEAMLSCPREYSFVEKLSAREKREILVPGYMGKYLHWKVLSPKTKTRHLSGTVQLSKGQAHVVIEPARPNK